MTQLPGGIKNLNSSSQFSLFSFIAVAQQSIILMFKKSNDWLVNPVQDKNWLGKQESAEMRSESRISVPLQSRKLYYQAISSCPSCFLGPPVNQVRCLQSCLIGRQTISYLVFAFICLDKRRYKGLISSTQVYTTMCRNRDYYTLVLLNPDMCCLCKEANWSRSALFAIKYVNLYQQSGSRNLIGWKLEMGMASLFNRTRVK